jgi:hypothetical protein
MWRLNQRDPKWAKLKIGNSPYTLGAKGCVTVNLSSLAQWYVSTFHNGKVVLPDELVKQLKYTATGLLYWKSIDDSELPFKFVYRYYKRDDIRIQNIMKSTYNSCMLQVDNGKHWVVPVGYSRVFGYRIYDPYYSDVVYLNKRYGNGIQGFAEFTLK